MSSVHCFITGTMTTIKDGELKRSKASFNLARVGVIRDSFSEGCGAILITIDGDRYNLSEDRLELLSTAEYITPSDDLEPDTRIYFGSEELDN